MIVLSLITKNSFERLKHTFIEVLESSLQLPYNTIILVDDSESDKTIETVKGFSNKYDKELVISRSRTPRMFKPTRATARQTAIDIFFENFSNEFLFFLDDDCILIQGWWKWVEENKILEDILVGEVWGVNWDADESRKKFLEALGINYTDYLIKKFNERGGTHDTLYRRKALEGVKIPPELHVYEDAWLHFYVTCRNFKSVINPIGVRHFHPMSLTDIKREKERLSHAIEIAAKYGIVEYEFARSLKTAKSFYGYLSLLRPVFGFIPMALTCIKLYGFSRGLREAYARQYLKLWFRKQALNLRTVITNIPPICKAILDYYNK